MRKIILGAAAVAAFLTVMAVVPPPPPVSAASQFSPDGMAVLEPNALTVSTGNYSSGHLIGAHTGGYLAFNQAARVSGGSGNIISACLNSKDTDAPAVDLVLFSSVPSNTTFTDVTTLNLHDNDVGKVVGHISFAAASWKTLSGSSYVCNAAVDTGYALVGTNVLYGALVARGLLTPASTSDFTLRLVVRRS